MGLAGDMEQNGVTFNIRYVGSVGVASSMKSLSFEQRTLVTRECIYIVCQSANFISPRQYVSEPGIMALVGEPPSVQLAGRNVDLVISPSEICVVDADAPESAPMSKRCLHKHHVPSVSFAAGGENVRLGVFFVGFHQETCDFVGYVAKNSGDGQSAQSLRRCYVFECGVDLGSEVLSAISDAFTRRINMLRQQLTAQVTTQAEPQPRKHESIDTKFALAGTPTAGPPDLVLQFRSTASSSSTLTDAVNVPSTQPPSEPPPSFPATRPLRAPPLPPRPGVSKPIPVTSATCSKSAAPSTPPSPPPVNYVNDDAALESPPRDSMSSLRGEMWYHGPLSRAEAVALLQHEGDFLVRQSTSDSAQYVLTGMQDGLAKHLLLMDANGKVRTADREFASVPHLIQYHRDNNLPITSTESAILLRNPILRRYT